MVPRPRALRSIDPVLAAIVVLSAALRFVLLLPPFVRILDELAIPDDAYLTLTIARSIGRGLGPLYGLARTNGFQPLIALLLAPVYALGVHDPDQLLQAALIVLALCDTAALVLLVRLVARLAEGRAVPRAVALSWALSPWGVLLAMNGMETALAVLLQVAVLERALAWTRPSPGAVLAPRRAAALGALLGLAALARVDGLLLAPALLLAFAPGLIRERPQARRLVAAAGAGAAGFAVVVLPWALAIWRWTHDLVPVSGPATRSLMLDSISQHPDWGNLYLHTLRWGVSTVVRKNAILLAACAGLAIVLVAGGARRAWRRLLPWRRALAAACVFGLALFAAYVGYVMGTWHFSRYLYPLSVPIALVFAALFDAALRGLARRSGRAVLVGATCAALVLGGALHPMTRRIVHLRPPPLWGYRAIGVWARDHFPPGTVIGGSQTGALGYYAEALTVVNLDGVVNRDAFEALRADRYLDYVRASGVRWLVWQDDISLFQRHSARLRPDDLVLVQTLPGLRSCDEGWHVYRVRR